MLFKTDRKKVKIGLLVWKSIFYRVLITGLQTVVTYLFTKNIALSISLSVVWNLINTLTYFIYDWVFSTNFEVRELNEK